MNVSDVSVSFRRVQCDRGDMLGADTSTVSVRLSVGSEPHLSAYSTLRADGEICYTAAEPFKCFTRRPPQVGRTVDVLVRFFIDKKENRRSSAYQWKD